MGAYLGEEELSVSFGVFIVVFFGVFIGVFFVVFIGVFIRVFFSFEENLGIVRIFPVLLPPGTANIADHKSIECIVRCSKGLRNINPVSGPLRLGVGNVEDSGCRHEGVNGH